MPDYGASIGNTRRHAFILDDEPDNVATTLTPEVAVVSVENAGDHGEVAGNFYGMGRAVASVRNPQRDYGGADGIVSDCMLAEYDPSTKKVYPLDTLGARTIRTKPWTVGKDVQLLCDPNKPSKGIVVRGNKTGDAGFDAHVYIAAPTTPGGGSSPIILHHRFMTAAPPTLSTVAFDDTVNSGWKAELSDALRIVAGIDWVCPPTTSPVKPKPVNWVVLNATQSGGKFSGFLAAAYSGGSALLSDEMGGFLAMATSPAHDLGYGHDGLPIRRGMQHADALIGRGTPNPKGGNNPKYEAPAWVEDVEEPDVMEMQGHPSRVHYQYDSDDTHDDVCSGRPSGKRKWHKREPIVETPPCEGTKPPKYASDGNVTEAMPATGMSYFVGTQMMNGLFLLSNPRA